MQKLPELEIGDLSQGGPRGKRDLEQRLGLPLVADPGNESLVEQRISDLTPLISTTEALDHGLHCRWVEHDVRPQPRQMTRSQLEYRTVPLHGLPKTGLPAGWTSQRPFIRR